MKLNSYTEVFNARWKNYYTVDIGISRWSKVGEVVDNKIIVHPRTHNVSGKGKCYYFDNADEAFAYAEEMRIKILNHLKGKKIDYVNMGRTLRCPFAEEYLMNKCQSKIGNIDDTVFRDFRYMEILPYQYGISISYCQDC